MSNGFKNIFTLHKKLEYFVTKGHKKTQTEGILFMENKGKRTGTTDVSIKNTVLEM